jgi:hypothetical protein
MSKREWGNSAWYLFHTLAEKLKPEHSNEAPVLLSVIINMCMSLPCEDCSQHAKINIRRVNLHRIQNKESLKKFLWEFHNIVNSQLRKRQITYHQCNEKYKSAKLVNIIKYFDVIFTRANRTGKLMLHTRTNINAKNQIVNYVKHNLYKFNIS